MSLQFQEKEHIETWWSSSQHDLETCMPPLPGKIKWVMLGEWYIIVDWSNHLGEYITVLKHQTH